MGEMENDPCLLSSHLEMFSYTDTISYRKTLEEAAS